jgi:hypothetical protein
MQSKKKLKKLKKRLDFLGFSAIVITMIRNNTLTLGKAYIVDGKPMVLHTIENGRYSFTDGRYGFGRTLGRRLSDAKILNNLKVAKGVNPQDILDKLQKSVEAMADFYRSK